MGVGIGVDALGVDAGEGALAHPAASTQSATPIRRRDPDRIGGGGAADRFKPHAKRATIAGLAGSFKSTQAEILGGCL
ncbi:MAG: hypothetical protein QOE90_2023 [Thermoplasmata archaeon]|nr:hypothetical protein [Thermoplasmata archaeon]